MIIVMYDTAKYAEKAQREDLVIRYNKGEHKLVGDYEFPYSIIEK